MAESSKRSRVIWVLVRLGVTLGALAFLFQRTDIPKLGAALAAIPLSAIVQSCGLAYVSLFFGALRWRLLMKTCGATSTPTLARLYQLSLVGLFYSTVLPGAVAGDVLRGLATAQSFEGKGATSSLAVTLLERLCGLGALVALASTAFLLNPLRGIEGVRFWGAVGLCAALAGIAAVAFSSKLARYLPAQLGKIAALMPDVQRPSGFAGALVFSLCTQLSMVLIGHTLITAIEPTVRFADSAVVMPVVTVASYFPLTIAGAGAREAALVAAYGLVGVAQPKAFAAAISLFACMLLVAATGGLINLVRPLRS